MKWFLTAAMAFVVVSLQNAAFASAPFPAEVDRYLMLTTGVAEFIGPPGQGCFLCHLSASGGNGTNNAFGTMMRNAGCQGTVVGSVDVALAKLEQTDPRAIADLKSGTDPNDDSLALNDDPVPRYGCGSIGATVPPRRTKLWLLVIIVGVGLALARGGGRWVGGTGTQS